MPSACLPETNGTSHNGIGNGMQNGNVKRTPQNLQNNQALPIDLVKDDLVRAFRENDTLIVMGETGSGKSTRLPQFLLDAKITQQIAITQPRRIAAISISRRVADERQVKVGEEVGYSVRFDENASKNTKLKYMTDGMLLREAQSDPSLKRYSCIVLDEAHERTISTDVLFGIIKGAQRRRSLKSGESRLKVVIMSATMDVDHFSKYFKCKVVYLEGRTFPINVRYAQSEFDDYIGASISTCLELHKSHPPNEHFLIFLTGQDEIEAAVRILREQISMSIANKIKMEILPLYAALNQNQQMKVFRPVKEGTRRVVISTNIAETSLTIPGIRHVIDSGRVKQKQYNTGSGMQLLKICWCSKAQVWQRAGRAGRESQGNVYRLYTEAQFAALADSSIPELRRSPLANVCLQLLNANVKNLQSFDFIDPPKPDAIQKALEELSWLKMVKRVVNTENLQTSSNWELTAVGKIAARFPLEPRIAKALILSADLQCSEECITIAALLSTENIYQFPANRREEAKETHRKFHSAEGDLISLLNTYKAFKKAKMNERWCYDNFLNSRHLGNVSDIRNQLRDIFMSLNLKLKSSDDNKSINKAFAQGMFMQCAELRPDGRYQEFGQNLHLKIHPSSVLFGAKPPFILFNELQETNQIYARNILVAEPNWVLEACPEWFKSKKLTAE